MKIIKISAEKTIRVPSTTEISALLKSLKNSIGDEYRASDDPEDDKPGMQVTIGANESGGWNYQIGDNSFSGGAYGYSFWSVVSLYRNSNCKELAKTIQDDLIEVQVW